MVGPRFLALPLYTLFNTAMVASYFGQWLLAFMLVPEDRALLVCPHVCTCWLCTQCGHNSHIISFWPRCFQNRTSRRLKVLSLIKVHTGWHFPVVSLWLHYLEYFLGQYLSSVHGMIELMTFSWKMRKWRVSSLRCSISTRSALVTQCHIFASRTRPATSVSNDSYHISIFFCFGFCYFYQLCLPCEQRAV